MTPKEQAAMQQALKALESKLGETHPFAHDLEKAAAIRTLREALDHSGEANEMVGCAYCNNPLFAGTKCNNCGLVTLAEQAEQEPVAWQGAEEWEPLAFQLCADENGEESCNELLWDGGVIPEPWGERWLKYEDEAKRMIEYVRKYAAPVRTKDLTDDEIRAIDWECKMDAVELARAVIAADREKNK